MKTRDEYNAALREINQNAEAAKVLVIKQHVDANNPYKVGDIITDTHTIIRIDKIAYYLSLSDPCAKFIGTQLKKDLTEAKRQDETVIYGNSSITKLN